MIKPIVGRNITFLYQKNHVRTEYGEILNTSEISNCKDEIVDVWNESNNEKVPDIKRGKYHNSLLTDDDRSLSIPRKFSRNLKENFPNHIQKYNASLTLWHEVNNKKLQYF